MNLYTVVILVSSVSYICCSGCSNLKTCGECISYAAETCVWCADELMKGSRCHPESGKHVSWCNKFRINPNSALNPDVLNANFSRNVQLRPQKIYIKARPGVEVKFDTHYMPAEHFPVDVYFLMDYTLTMMTHKDALEREALNIYKSLTNMTSNVRLGVGSFVEKPALPYMDVENQKKKYEHYTFRNHLSLTNDTTTFQQVIRSSKFGSNYDDAEAALDALMQVMKCEKELDWRKKTRRIIVLATDNTYHSAGDGKMVGAIKPNDMQCHLQDNEYKSDFALKYDYPTVSQINKAAVDGNFLIIFAVLNHVKSIYQLLSNQVLGSKVALLKNEKSNIMQIIKDAYEESVAKAKLDSSKSDSIIIKIEQSCEKNLFNCESTPNNQIVTIPITIKSKKCVKEDITINPIGLEEKLIVEFESDCQCDCEKSPPVEKSPKCNNAGIVQCGACVCDEHRGGDFCEYNCSDAAAEDLKKRCRPGNATLDCNGHGTCTCGKCSCSDDFTGDICEFSPDSCVKAKNGKVCGGDGFGICEYGRCTCIDHDSYTGDACDCPAHKMSLIQCTGPFSNEACSGRGECKCGQCICGKVKHTDEKYLGAYCDFCNDCATERCKELEGYAKCNYNSTKEYCNKQYNLTIDNMNVDVLVANRSVLRDLDEWKKGTPCKTDIDDKKILLFKYAADPETTTKLLLRIQYELESAPEQDVLVAIASTILGVLLIGIFTAILWKVLVNVYDKREYDKFCTEAKSQGFDTSQNPLYEPPTTVFVNPGFNQTAD